MRRKENKSKELKIHSMNVMYPNMHEILYTGK